MPATEAEVLVPRFNTFNTEIPEPIWIRDEVHAKEYIDYFLKSHALNNSLGLDTETTGLDKIRDSVVIWSLADKQVRICVDRSFLHIFREPLLENKDINFDLTNAKFDMHMLANSGVDLSKAGECRDTVTMSWLLNENNTGRHGLKECIFDHFGRRVPTFEETFGKIPVARKKGEVKKTPGQIIRETLSKGGEYFARAVDYASLDAYDSHILRIHLDGLLDQTNLGWGTLKDYFYRVEVPFTKVLYLMERRGITIDVGHFAAQADSMLRRMDEFEREFNREVSAKGQRAKKFNLRSNHDLRWFFFDLQKKEVIKETKGGKSGIKNASTDVEVLETWAGEGDTWAQKLLDYRSIQKIWGTYVEGLRSRVDAHYRIHTNLNQAGTVTGRLSSSEPNLQNIPRPDEDEFKIREAFIAGHKKKLLVADYEQLEMRLLAHFSKCWKMIDAIKGGMDIHSLTTAEVEGIPYEDVVKAKKTPKDQYTDLIIELINKRQNNKATGFGIVYGIGGPKLARKLTRETKKYVSDEEGWQLIRKWLNVFPEVEVYIEQVKEDMKKFGCVPVITGRLRRFGELRTMSRKDVAQAERQGVNSQIQGTAAEAAKYAMIVAENDSVLKSLGADLLLQVHDELVWEIPDDAETEKKAIERVKQIMENPFGYDLLVPLPISVHAAYTWAEAK